MDRELVEKKGGLATPQLGTILSERRFGWRKSLRGDLRRVCHRFVLSIRQRRIDDDFGRQPFDG